MTSVTAFSPASVGNAGVGFDVLGFAFGALGDRVTVERDHGSGIRVEVEGIDGVPTDPERNTASVALRALLDARGVDGSFYVRVQKGIPLSAGMGGSAASAVGAVVAGNELLGLGMGPHELLPFALVGEACASGGYHSDNVAPCLFGGLTASTPGPRPRVLSLPLPDGLTCVIVHPQVKVDTREARAALAQAVPLGTHVQQSAELVAFVAALHRGDLDLLATCMRDVVAEPQRARLVPGFSDAQRAAMDAGAIGCSIAGSGPSVFAWTREDESAPAARDALIAALGSNGCPVVSWTAVPGGPGAAVVDTR